MHNFAYAYCMGNLSGLCCAVGDPCLTILCLFPRGYRGILFVMMNYFFGTANIILDCILKKIKLKIFQ